MRLAALISGFVGYTASMVVAIRSFQLSDKANLSNEVAILLNTSGIMFVALAGWLIYHAGLALHELTK